MGVNDVDRDPPTSDVGRLQLAGMALAIEQLASKCSPETRTALVRFLIAATDTTIIGPELACDDQR